MSQGQVFISNAIVKRRTCRSLWVGCVLAFAVGGCAHVENLWIWNKSDISPGGGKVVARKSPVEVKVKNARRLLEDGNTGVMSAAEFVSQVDDMLANAQLQAARRWICRYPDLALEVLGAATSRQAASATWKVIAETYDKIGTVSGCDANWSALLQHRERNPEHYAAYEKSRQQFVEFFENEQWADAADIRILSQLPSDVPTILRIDALELDAKIKLQTGKFSEAEKQLAQALSLADEYSHQRVYLLLAYSDALRRAERHNQANAVWLKAGESASELLSGAKPVIDPVLWERCAYLRPTHLPWPSAVQERFSGWNQRHALISNIALASPSGTKAELNNGEALVWACIGRSHLERDEPKSALLALKRSEAWAMNSRFRYDLQLAQARAFGQMNQPVPAMAILSRLAAGRVPDVSAAALAMIGALKLQEGNVEQGLAALRKSVEQSGTHSWPGRSEAEANLGLAYLMADHEAKGLQWLHSAQRSFESENNQPALTQCLRNELRYLENAGKSNSAEIVRKRLSNFSE